MTTVVITQSMLFPWVGLLEQVRLADIVVHYDDVQFSKGSFVNRVQLKLPGGPKWMTVPLTGLRLGQSIDEVLVDNTKNWRGAHSQLLTTALQGAPRFPEAIELLRDTYANPAAAVGEVARRSFMSAVDYFGLRTGRDFVHAKDLHIRGDGSERVLAIVKELGGTVYVTGLGARNYLDHERFEREGVAVRYMNYRLTPYPQRHGAFTPYVSCLDLVANMGKAGKTLVHSESMDWRTFLERS